MIVALTKLFEINCVLLCKKLFYENYVNHAGVGNGGVAMEIIAILGRVTPLHALLRVFIVFIYSLPK